MHSDNGRRDIAINGRFLAQKLSGVQRYSREIVTAMDRLIQSDGNRLGRHRWRLLLPPGVGSDLALQSITVETVGSRRGHIWEQRDLLRAAAGARLLNLGNSAPVLHRDKLVVIHDAAVFRTPRNFGYSYRAGHRALGWALARTGRIATVSEFSRRELAQVLRLREETIALVRNGCDHFVGRACDETVLNALDLEPQRYFLFVGNPTPNKNLTTLLQAFAGLDRPGAKLVLAGSLDSSVFGGAGALQGNNVVLTSGRSDAEIAALYMHASAHVFPSVYEGFGIPPLEAMASGCPVIASDIPVTREVCGKAASYFPPCNVDALAALLRRHWDASGRTPEWQASAVERLNRFKWSASARTMIEAALAP
jgi:glycosyltransferase involved in cell wall biosynthesis